MLLGTHGSCLTAMGASEVALGWFCPFGFAYPWVNQWWLGFWRWWRTDGGDGGSAASCRMGGGGDVLHNDVG